MDVEKLLSIPMLPVRTGTVMGQKVVEFVREWPGVEEQLAGLCFDTTASNTGIHTGAITIVQQSLSRQLLFIACRHDKFHPLDSDAAGAGCLTAPEKTWFESCRADVVRNIQQDLTSVQPCDDYKEFAQLT